MASEMSTFHPHSKVYLTIAITFHGSGDASTASGKPPSRSSGNSTANSQLNPIIIDDDHDNDGNDNKEDGDDELLHPKPRESILSKKDRKIMKANSRLNRPIWVPGTVIRLLSDAVHIKTCPEKGLDIDPGLPCPPLPPKRVVLPLESQMLFVGKMDGDKSHRFFYEGKRKRGWMKGAPMFMRVGIYEPHRVKLVDATGLEVDLSVVRHSWASRLGSIEGRIAATERLRMKINDEMQLQDQRFEEAAKEYRIARRLWEISVVKHEFFKRKNYEIFRPGVTRGLVLRIIRMGKKDIQNETENDNIRKG